MGVYGSVDGQFKYVKYSIILSPYLVHSRLSRTSHFTAVFKYAFIQMKYTNARNCISLRIESLSGVWFILVTKHIRMTFRQTDEVLNPYMRSVRQIWSQNFDGAFFIRRSWI